MITYQGHQIHLSPPWPKMTVETAFERFGSMDMRAALAADRFEEVLAFDIEPHLGMDRPVFLHDYPAAFNTLAALIPGRPDLSQRFELYIIPGNMASERVAQKCGYVQEGLLRKKLNHSGKLEDANLFAKVL